MGVRAARNGEKERDGQHRRIHECDTHRRDIVGGRKYDQNLISRTNSLLWDVCLGREGRSMAPIFSQRKSLGRALIEEGSQHLRDCLLLAPREHRKSYTKNYTRAGGVIVVGVGVWFGGPKWWTG